MIFYRSFYEAVNELPKELQADIYSAIFKLGFDFERTELSGISKTIFKLVEPIILANNQRFMNATEARHEQDGSKRRAKPKRNRGKTSGNKDRDKDKDVDKDKDNKNSDLVIQIVRVLNEVTESDFRPSSKATSKLISARINDGYSFDELKDVILHKTAQWKNDPKMKSYLRPETIFGSKFESYLQEAKKNISDDPETKYQRLKARGFKNVSKEEIIWVFNYQHRTPSSYSDYPKDELIGERGEYYTQEEIERLFA